MVTPLDELLNKMVEVGASDLHLKVGSPPVVRIDGDLHATKLPPLIPDDTITYAESIFTPKAAASFRETNEANFAYGRREFGRFRVNVFRQRGSVGVVMRRVHHELPSVEQLGLPPAIERLKEIRSGLVIVAGPSSSGKTTTLASMVDYINRNEAVNIVTLEDPIEVVHRDVKSIVSQREIGMDTKSYATALEHVLRQDPDVILIDQMNDAETVRAVLQASEMGHLVFSSLPTVDAAESVNRLIDYFPESMQKQIRAQLAGQLEAVICQRLLERADGEGRVPAVELLQTSDAVKQCIVNPDFTGELSHVIALAHPTMQTYEQAIDALYQEGTITHEVAMAAASDREALYARIGPSSDDAAPTDEPKHLEPIEVEPGSWQPDVALDTGRDDAFETSTHDSESAFEPASENQSEPAFEPASAYQPEPAFEPASAYQPEPAFEPAAMYEPAAVQAPATAVQSDADERPEPAPVVESVSPLAPPPALKALPNAPSLPEPSVAESAVAEVVEEESAPQDGEPSWAGPGAF